MATRMPDILFTDKGTYYYHNSYFSLALANKSARRLRSKGLDVIVKSYTNAILPGASIPWPGTKDMTGKEKVYGVYRKHV